VRDSDIAIKDFTSKSEVMNEFRTTTELEAPQWTPQTHGIRTLALQGVVTLQAGDESKTADAEIMVIERDFRRESKDGPSPCNWRLRTSVVLSDIRADVFVDFRGLCGTKLHSTAFLTEINSAGLGYTGKKALEGLVGAGLFPPPSQ
jgi:hypothetical protein